MINNLKVLIIIPVKEINDYIRESVSHILNLDYHNFEILIFPDQETKENFPKTRIIPTGKIGPAEKRDLAIKYAQGEILAFLDDDAYPKKNWLKNAIKHFENENIAAVGGPAITPQGDSLLQKASACVFESFLGGGNCRYRYLPFKKVFFVDDFPSVNFLIRTDIFKKLNGFDNTFWPGEDTKLCLNITKKLNKKIIYDPKVQVFHHRRKGFRSHLKQVCNYALHRGFFAKKFPETSLRLGYFVPSFFVLYLILGLIFCFFIPWFWILYFGILSIYFLGLLFDGILAAFRYRKSGILVLALIPLTVVNIFLTHFFYGIWFLKGILKEELKK